MARLVIKLDPRGRHMLMDRHPELQYIGIVYRGQEFGALALSPAGEYLKVNGDMVRVLNASQVDEALHRVGIRRGSLTGLLPVPERGLTWPALSTGAFEIDARRPSPVVVVRQRRRISQPSPRAEPERV